MSDSLLDSAINFGFELGKCLLKLELSKRDSGTLIRTLGGNETEKIVLQKIGKFWNQQNIWDRPDGLVVITNHRFVFLSKVETITTKTEFLSIPFEFIERLEKTKVWGFTPAVRFWVQGKEFVFTFLTGADDVLPAIRKNFDRDRG